MSNQTVIPAKYVKSGSYSPLPMHGVFGGISTAGQIAMHVYSEAPALPESAQVSVTTDDDGAVLSVSEVAQPGSGTERVVSATYYLDIAMAEALATWLQGHINVLKGHIEARQ